MMGRTRRSRTDAESPVAAAETSSARRAALITEIEAKREGTFLISYITSTRPGFEVGMADDVLPLFHEKLEAGKQRAAKGVDLFIHSNGGSGTTPWRIVNLIREYTKNFTVLVPHHAFSAATLVALGADKVVMHKMGYLGPIDPSVTNAFNPQNPQNPAQLLPISVEDVTAYFTMIKEDIGVRHEDELIKAVIALTEKVHPLALGNVQRSHHQSRMIARKLLRKHMTEGDSEHEIDKLVENLKSNLYFHGHPINRLEARADLNIKIEDAAPDLEDLMWRLYQEYATELQMMERYNVLYEWEARQSPPAAPLQPPTTQDILLQMRQLAAAGLGLGAGVTEQQLVNLAVAMIPHIAGAIPGSPSTNKVRLDELKGAYVESLGNTHVFLTDLTIERDRVHTQAGPQDVVKQETIWQRWEIEA
jgi:hypothetical protein